MSFKSVKVIFPVMVIVFVISGLVLFQKWQAFMTNPVGQTSLIFEVEPGENLKSLANKLHRVGYIENPTWFVLLVRLANKSTDIQAGVYQLDADLTPKQLLHKLVTGDVIKVNITFIEGWTFQRYLHVLHGDPNIIHTLEAKIPEQIMAQLGFEERNPEGLFFPDTYRFDARATDIDVLRRAYQRMQSELDKAWQERADNLPYKTPYQALIAASLIEKETSVDHEKPMVAGVIVRRLQKGMRLQMDPTVIYGLQAKYDGKLTRKDLRTPSPYNTYLNYGLPPTPIAMPGLASIAAALNPDSGDSLYFVAKGDGTHYFSSNLKDHNAAVRRYILNQ